MSVYSWNTSAASNASADANIDWTEGMLPSLVNDSARAMMAALASMIRDQGGYATLGGSGNTFTLTLSQTMASKVPAIIGFLATRANTGAVTMNIDSSGGYPLRKNTGVDLVSGDIVNGAFYIITWDSANSEWKIANQSGLLPLTGGTMTGNLSIVSGTTEMKATLGSSGGYFYGNDTDAGWKNSGDTARVSWNISSGDFTAAGNVTAYSDAKLKENVETIREALSLVKRMRGVFYDRIDTGEHGVGVIAQEMREVIPQAVKPNDGTLSVAYGNLVGVLIEAVKELSAKVEALEAR